MIKLPTDTKAVFPAKSLLLKMCKINSKSIKFNAINFVKQNNDQLVNCKGGETSSSSRGHFIILFFINSIANIKFIGLYLL